MLHLVLVVVNDTSERLALHSLLDTLINNVCDTKPCNIINICTDVNTRIWHLVMLKVTICLVTLQELYDVEHFAIKTLALTFWRLPVIFVVMFIVRGESHSMLLRPE